MSQGTSQDIATFRDPAGSLRITGERVLRTVHPRHAGESLRFLQSDLARRWVAQGHLVPTEVLSAEENEPVELEHPRIFFPSYPWEWTPGQWVAAAELTLELCRQALHEGWILKDATPLNILFDGPNPVFVDVLSFEPRDPRSPLWIAYGQFARTFLLPLAAYKHLGWPLVATLTRRDGYEPTDLYPYLSKAERWKGPLRSLVTVPYLLEKRKRGVAKSPTFQQQPEVAQAVLARNLKGFGKTLRALEPRGRNSRWSDYQTAADHYTDQERSDKQGVRRAHHADASTGFGPRYRRQHRAVFPRSGQCRCARGGMGYRCGLVRSQLARGPHRGPVDSSVDRGRSPGPLLLSVGETLNR